MDWRSTKKYIYSNENKINNFFYKMVLFRIYLIEKMIFIFLKLIHGYFLMVENIFLNLQHI